MATDLTTEAVRLAMGIEHLRAENASRNIAHANTPGAQATRLDFGGSLGLLQQAAQAGVGDASLLASLDSAASKPVVATSLDDAGKGIQLDSEVADMAGANLEYQALADSLSRHFGLMRLAISGRN